MGYPAGRDVLVAQQKHRAFSDTSASKKLKSENTLKSDDSSRVDSLYRQCRQGFKHGLVPICCCAGLAFLLGQRFSKTKKFIKDPAIVLANLAGSLAV